jgi:hypothetical protein
MAAARAPRSSAHRPVSTITPPGPSGYTAKLWNTDVTESVTAAHPNHAASSRRVTSQARCHASALPAALSSTRKITTPG